MYIFYVYLNMKCPVRNCDSYYEHSLILVKNKTKKKHQNSYYKGGGKGFLRNVGNDIPYDGMMQNVS